MKKSKNKRNPSSNEESTIAMMMLGKTNYSFYKTLSSHTAPVRCLLQVNDQQIATGSFDATVKIWNTKTGLHHFTLTGHTNWIYSLAKLNNETIASGSSDNTIKIWNVSKGKLIRTLVDHTDSVIALIKLNDSFMISGSYDSTMKLWSLSDWTVKKTINTPEPIQSLLLLSSNKIAVGNNGDWKIRIYDINSDKFILTLTDHASYIYTLIPWNDSQIISGSWDKTIKLWDVHSGSLVQETLFTFHAQVLSMVNLKNGFIAVGLGGKVNNLALMRTSDWSIQTYLNGHTSHVYSLFLLSDGRLLSGSEDSRAIISSDGFVNQEENSSSIEIIERKKVQPKEIAEMAKQVPILPKRAKVTYYSQSSEDKGMIDAEASRYFSNEN